MSRAVIQGAGVTGHTAAAFARKRLPKRDEAVVVSPLPHYWVPSGIRVGVGQQPKQDAAHHPPQPRRTLIGGHIRWTR